MLPRPTTPARVLAALELAQHDAMARKLAAGDVAGAEATRRALPGWARLRSMAARDEPKNAWTN